MTEISTIDWFGRRGHLFSLKTLLYFTFYFEMQLLRYSKKNLPCFPSERENLQSAILFILSTATAIITQTNLMETAFC